MSVLMRTFVFQTESDIGYILKENNAIYEKNAFELKIKDMQLSSEYAQPNMDFVCSTAYINPLKIQCGSCFTLIRKDMILCDVIFEQVINGEGSKMFSLIQYFSEDDRIIVLNGLFTNVFGLQHLFIRPAEKNVSLFHFVHCKFPLYKDNTLLNPNFSDTDIYSIFGIVIEINKHIDGGNMHLKLQCYSYKNDFPNNNECENFCSEEIRSMVKCNCFPDLINVLINEPCLNFTSIVPDQKIHLKNLKVDRSNSSGINLYVKGKLENLNTVPTDVA